MASSFKEQDYKGHHRMILVSGKPADNKERMLIAIVKNLRTSLNVNITYNVIDEIKDETSLYKTLCLEKNGFVVFSENATKEIFSNEDYIVMLKEAGNYDADRTLIAPSGKYYFKAVGNGPQYYNTRNEKIPAGLFPSEFTFNGFIILLSDKNIKELQKDKILKNHWNGLSRRCRIFNFE